MVKIITKERAVQELKKRYAIAEEYLKDENKLKGLLLSLEEKIKELPFVGEKLSYVVSFADMLRSYIMKEYRAFPLGTLLAVISAVLYLILPGDLIPDVIPVIGYTDDVTIVAVCWSLVEMDVKKYLAWRDGQRKEIEA